MDSSSPYYNKWIHDILFTGSMPAWKSELYECGFVQREPFYAFLLVWDIVFRGISQVFYVIIQLLGFLFLLVY